ncbi:MAG: hypothetical protein ACLTCJ_09740 [Gemmiger formicilis]|uniref:hypothetical protein n=1 Tax=Gemmiger formicilis TaxID=745368 RepID=UPI003A1ED21E
MRPSSAMQPMPCATAVSTPEPPLGHRVGAMLCAKLFDKPECRTAAEAILKEGNDCNEDGEYAERSAYNYNRINNDAMIMLAVATGDESYYAPVRNLEMMLTYIDPDDSIFTNNSTRWDMGKKIYPREYYLEYLTWAIPAASPNCWTQPTPLCRWWSATPCAALTASST